MGPEFIASIVDWDERLPHNQVVLGVASGKDYGAYPVNLITAEGGVVNDRVGLTDVVLLVEPISAYSVAYDRRLGDRLLEFTKLDDLEFSMMDSLTGSIWNIEGTAIAGPLKGERLTFVPSYLAEWYGWSAYHPGTKIYP
jgi:hypothetical protein